MTPENLGGCAKMRFPKIGPRIWINDGCKTEVNVIF